MDTVLISERQSFSAEPFSFKTDPIPENIVIIYLTELLIGLGFKANHRGFVYLRDSLILSAAIPYTKNKNRILYEAVSEKYGVTSRNVERTIRYAINTAFESGSESEWGKVFVYIKNGVGHIPSNAEFIATVSDRLRFKSIS